MPPSLYIPLRRRLQPRTHTHTHTSMFSLPARRAVCQGSRFLPSQSVRLTCLTLCLPSSPHISSTIGTLQPPHTRSSSIPRSNHFSTSSIARLGGEPQEEQEMNSGEKSIHDILTKEFQPATLQVQDVSGESNITF